MRLKQLLLLAVLLLSPWASQAAVCSVNNVQAVNFGTVNPLAPGTPNTSMTFGYSCAKQLGDLLAGITVCFNLYGAGIGNRSMAFAGPPASTLSYELYQGSVSGGAWGNQTQQSTIPVLKLNLLSLTPVTGTLTVYGQMTLPQTAAAPGNYLDSYSSVQATVTMNTGALGPPADCGASIATNFAFDVMATVSKQCNVSYANNVSFGAVAAMQSNLASNNTIGIACTNGTLYTVGLTPSNNNTGGTGVLKGTGANTDQVPYQLRQASGASGAVWGNTASNYRSSTGTGIAQQYPVYVTIPSTNYTPDDYADTVTITVTY
ncbi:Spore coat protein U [Cedecea neteri]|uniref:Spore coat protein U n=1 Tax=Cedecea neteri TaxID=158822 RepID=A0A089Q703_9ENTR|nr:spore coat U domain-containing protein [Cedecea neteri]AIR07081.1 Spore coat protein U [Cedecea neteri]